MARFLSQLSLHFWGYLLESSFYVRGSFWVRSDASDFASDDITDRVVGVMQGLDLNLPEKYDILKVWDVIKTAMIQYELEFERRNPKSSARSFLPACMAATFLRICGYKGSLREMLRAADGHLLKTLFDRIADEVGNKSRFEWYLGMSCFLQMEQKAGLK